MTTALVPTLSREEARSLTDEVKQDAERLWRKLVELYEGRAHEALGYASWDAFCLAEFGMGRTRSYQLLAAGRVLAEVREPDRHSGLTRELLSPQSTIVDSLPTNEAQARELAPLLSEPKKLREAWAEANERSNGHPTAAVVREVVEEQRSGRMDVHYSSETNDWSTPPELFGALDAEFGFDLDVCASDGNAKCATYYTEREDGLSRPWSGVCWMNPPYGSEIGRWVRKAYESAQAGATVVCLVPARVDTAWWWDYCRFGEVRFLRGRLRFGGADAGAPFPSAVVVFGRVPDTVYWNEWKAAA